MTTSYNKAYAKQGSYQQNGFAEGRGIGYANPSDYATKHTSDKLQAVIALAMLVVACALGWVIIAFGTTIKAVLF